MKIKLAVLLALLCIVPMTVHANTITVDYFAIPSVFPNPNTTIAHLFLDVTNLTNYTIFLDGQANSYACFPDTATTDFTMNQYNAAGDFAFAPHAEVLYPWEVVGAVGTIGRPPGLYLFPISVYGGFTEANDHILLGAATALVTVTPEPSTLLLFGTGLLGVVAAMRRKLLR